jgi:hypothetical protein
MRDTELQMLSFLVANVLSKDEDFDLKNSVLKKIDQKIQSGAVDEPPQHLLCPISFVIAKKKINFFQKFPKKNPEFLQKALI